MSLNKAKPTVAIFSRTVAVSATGMVGDGDRRKSLNAGLDFVVVQNCSLTKEVVKSDLGLHEM